MAETPESVLAALLGRRGLATDAERAAALRPLAESLLDRLARLAGALPRDAVPPAPAALPDRER